MRINLMATRFSGITRKPRARLSRVYRKDDPDNPVYLDFNGDVKIPHQNKSQSIGLQKSTATAQAQFATGISRPKANTSLHVAAGLLSCGKKIPGRSTCTCHCVFM